MDQLVAIAIDIETGFTVDISYMVSSMPASHESKAKWTNVPRYR